MSDIRDFREALADLVPEVVEETAGSLPSRMLAATLGHDIPSERDVVMVATLAHWLHCLPIVGHNGLDDNGHPRRGNTLPDLPYAKRMFAGADIRFVAPMRIGERVRRTGRVTEIVPKEGKSGSFFLVNVRQEYTREDGGLLLEEDQKLVYRASVGGASTGHQADPNPEADWSRSYLPDERMLFRYSALLFSAHRIHFDREFTRGEGYPALVVHGQLAATCLLRLAEEKMGREIESFSYRSIAPLFENRKVTACGRPNGEGALLWAVDDDGTQCVTARAHFKPR